MIIVSTATEQRMPIYQFICEKHGVFEKITIKAEWDDIRCPECGNKPKIREKMQLERNRSTKKI
jgi:putative FmdB family regulatory protein